MTHGGGYSPREIAQSSNTSPDPEVCVAVSTYQRALFLPGLISALEAQTLGGDRFEVVIVDDGSTDGTARLLAELAASTNLSLRALSLDGNRGPSAGRNAAWRSTSAPFVAFTDDDCCPRPDWLAAGLKAMKESDAVVAGRTTPVIPFSECGPFVRTINLADARYLATCNVFYRRADLEAVHGFDESYNIPPGEDTDLAWRVRDELGRPFRFEPSAVVAHAVKPSDLAAALRKAISSYGIPYFVYRHPDARRSILHRRIFWKPSHPKALLAVLGVALLVAALIGIAPIWSTLVGSAFCVPWLWHRLRSAPLPTRRMRYRPLYLPGALAIDLAEVAAMVRGSIKYRTFVL